MQAHVSGRRPAVFESDIDELLANNLSSDRQFAASLVAEVALQCTLQLRYERLLVERQVRHEGATGSIDLLVRLLGRDAVETGRILIENKLDSSFTVAQPERYAASATAMSRAGRPAIPVICAPGEYLSKSRYLAPFRARITYENVADWLAEDARSLMRQALTRFSMPYEPDPVPEVADFHDGYGRLVQELAPELVVKPNPNTAGARPEASRTIYFVVKKSLPILPFLPTLRFSHQCWDSDWPAPSVKVMFGQWAKHERMLRSLSAPALGNTRLYLRKAGRSLGLVHDTPRMDNKRPVAAQMDAVATGIRAAAAVRAWMFANEPTLREWAEAVERGRSGLSHL